MWCNNAIICTVLRINRRYFSSKKNSVEICNAYMQEVHLKFYNFPLILLTFLFLAWCMHRNFSFKISGVVPWSGDVRNIILLHTHTHTHTHIILSQHFTNNFSLHPTLYSHATPACTENDLGLLSFVPVYQHVPYFPVCFSRWEIENFYIVFSYSLKEGVIVVPG